MATGESASDSNDVDERSDPYPGAMGVLLSNMIEAYNAYLNPQLIQGADPKFLRPACYDLRLADKYYQDGLYRVLTKESPILTIRPHGMVVVGSLEKLHLPRYMIGRWSLRVKLVYAGLLWSGGAQVDPGFSGNLFCPLYNLSNTDVTLVRGQHIFTIDFVKTSEFTKGSKLDPSPPAASDDFKRFPSQNQNREIEAYVPAFPLTSSVANLQEEFERTKDTIDKKVDDLQSTLLVGLSIVFSGLIILATVLSIPNIHLTYMVDPLTVFLLSLPVASVIMSIYALIRTRRRNRTTTIYADLAKLQTELSTGAIDQGTYDKKRKKLGKKLRGWLRRN